MQPSLLCFIFFGFLGTVLAGRPPFGVKQPAFYRGPASSSTTLPSAGGLPIAGGSLSSFGKKVKSFLTDALPEEIPKPDKALKVAGNFFQKQMAAEQERRDFDQEHALHNSPKNLRIAELSVAAFVVAGIIDFILGNQDYLQSYWTSTLHPVVLGRIRQIRGWWSALRPALLEQICQVNGWWNKGRGILLQFSPNYKRAFGFVVGLMLSPVLWSVTSVGGGVFLGAGIAVVELNHHFGQRIEEMLAPLSAPLSQGWSEMDNTLEQVRGRFHDLLKRPTQLGHSPVQQGVLVGAMLGFAAEI